MKGPARWTTRSDKQQLRRSTKDALASQRSLLAGGESPTTEERNLERSRSVHIYLFDDCLGVVEETDKALNCLATLQFVDEKTKAPFTIGKNKELGMPYPVHVRNVVIHQTICA